MYIRRCRVGASVGNRNFECVQNTSVQNFRQIRELCGVHCIAKEPFSNLSSAVLILADVTGIGERSNMLPT